MRSLYEIWKDQSTAYGGGYLKHVCKELLEFKSTGIVPQQGQLQALANLIREEGYPGHNSIIMATDLVQHFAVEAVAEIEMP